LFDCPVDDGVDEFVKEVAEEGGSPEEDE